MNHAENVDLTQNDSKFALMDVLVDAPVFAPLSLDWVVELMGPWYPLCLYVFGSALSTHALIWWF